MGGQEPSLNARFSRNAKQEQRYLIPKMCRVMHGGKVYNQSLQSCREPETFKRVPHCTETSGRINLMRNLKKCFRRELKKGGFTIEKVCQYQSIAKTFKNVGNLKRYIEGNGNSRKCTGYNLDGT